MRYKALAPMKGNDKVSHAYLGINISPREPKPDITKYNILIDGRIPLSSNEMITLNLKQYKNGLTLYGLQYIDKDRKFIIRADNRHGYSHMDIILDGKKVHSHKRLPFGPTYSGFENILNLVLRTAEQNSPYVGFRYWLQHLGILDTSFINWAAEFVSLCKEELQIQTSLTDIARIFMIKLLKAIKDGERITGTQLGKELFPKWLSEIYATELKIAKPIEVKEVELPENVSALPFFVAAPPRSRVEFSVYVTKPGIVNLMPWGIVSERLVN